MRLKKINAPCGLNNMNYLDKIKAFISRGSERSINAKKNIIGSFLIKGISILVNLLIIPITINYVNPTQYGIWLAISSVILWFAYFDMGFTHGFRNRFAEAKANGNIELAQSYVSTTYALLFFIFFGVGIITFVANFFLDWSNILNVSAAYKEELTKVFEILIVFFSLQMVVKIIETLLTADQKPALASVIMTVGQVLVLVVIFVLTKFTTGSLVILALVLSLMPFLAYVVASLYFYNRQYKAYRPTIKSINFNLTSSIIGLGAKFFVIQISMLLIFQGVNLILVRIAGAESVTVYNVASKYFNTIPMIMNIILAPLWSAYTDAYVLNDYKWMINTYKRLDKTWLLVFLLAVIMLLLSPFVYKIWIGDKIIIPVTTSIFIFVYQVIMTRANLYMILLNGIGKVQIQMYIYVTFGVITIPLLVFFCKIWGINGVILITTLPFLIQMIFNHIQIQKVLRKTATGIWDK